MKKINNKITVTIAIKINNKNYDYALADSLKIDKTMRVKDCITVISEELTRLLLENKILTKKLNALQR